MFATTAFGWGRTGSCSAISSVGQRRCAFSGSISDMPDDKPAVDCEAVLPTVQVPDVAQRALLILTPFQTPKSIGRDASMDEVTLARNLEAAADELGKGD